MGRFRRSQGRDTDRHMAEVYIIKRKFPQKELVIDKLLMVMSFEYVYTPDTLEEGLFNIRDIKDYPVLYTAIIENVDILITGDKDKGQS